MKGRIIFAICLFLATSAGQALACAACYGARDGKTTEHMAVAIWVLMGVVMTVMGGVGAFSFHLWRHANMPLEPHQQLTDEDLRPYE
jgi:putative Mn2+ efflux pump MntP